MTSYGDYVTQCDVNTFAKWVDENFIVKCKCMVISKLRSRAIPSQQMYMLNQLMDRVPSYKYLGVNFIIG